MRVYEFAKQVDKPAKELVALLQKEGFEIRSHMTQLDEKALAFLKKKFDKKPAPQPSPKPKKPAQPKAKPSMKQSISSVKPLPQPLELPTELVIQPTMVSDIATVARIPVNEIIITLLKWGIVAPKNTVLGQDIVQRIADHYEIATVQPTAQEEKKGSSFIEGKKGIGTIKRRKES